MQLLYATRLKVVWNRASGADGDARRRYWLDRRSPDGIKVKNPNSPTVSRVIEGRRRANLARYGEASDAGRSNEPAHIHRGTWWRGGLAARGAGATATRQGLARWLSYPVVAHQLHRCIP